MQPRQAQFLLCLGEEVGEVGVERRVDVARAAGPVDEDLVWSRSDRVVEVEVVHARRILGQPR